MKQDLHNNTNIKQVFENREISPSANSWNKLAGLLDEQLPVNEQQIIASNKSKTNYKYFLGVAAVLLCICGFTFWTLSDNDNLQSFKETNKAIVQEDSFTEMESASNNMESASNNSKDVYQTTDTSEQKQVKKITNTKLKLGDTKLASVISDFSIDESEVGYKKNDTVLQSATVKPNNKVNIAWESRTLSEINVNPNSLLRNVERELIQDHAEAELNKPKDRFEQIRVAILNRNIQE